MNTPAIKRWLSYKDLGDYTPFTAYTWRRWVSQGRCPVRIHYALVPGSKRPRPCFDRHEVDQWIRRGEHP